jgi:hypothetical protein
MSIQDYGFATVTFRRSNPETSECETHDVRVDFTVPVDPNEVDALELAWDAAELFPAAGWGDDAGSSWGVSDVTVTIHGDTHDIFPFTASSRR